MRLRLAVSLPKALMLPTISEAHDQLRGAAGLRYGLIGAALVELAWQGRLRSDGETLALVETRTTGDALLDASMREVCTRPAASSLRAWILHLSHALRDRGDHASFIAAFSGSNRFVVDYLVEEVLNHLPHHLHTFLLETSILDRLCGELCDALLGVTSDERQVASSGPTSQVTQAYSQLILDQLERSNLFLTPLDDDRHWYRYHPLFAEVLRSRLISGASAAHVATLHHRASEWFERQSLEVETVAHALVTNDRERTAC